MYKIKSKSTGSFFGTYATRKAADADAVAANDAQKHGADDWEVAPKSVKQKDIDDDPKAEARAIFDAGVDSYGLDEMLNADDDFLKEMVLSNIDSDYNGKWRDVLVAICDIRDKHKGS